MLSKYILEEKIQEIGGKAWRPIEVARVNNQIVRLALFEGEYHWHRHAGEDELFLVYKGTIIIQLRKQPDIVLREGEIAVVPKGVEHCPKSVGPSYVLMFEPENIQAEGS